MRYRLLMCVVLAFAAPVIQAQELNCDVSINMEGIPSANRELLKNFESDVERYINGTRYTNEDLGNEKIDCTINIFFKSVTGENKYSVEAFIGSQRTMYVGNDKSDRATPVLRIKDDKWEFIYLPGQQMRFDEYNFEPLTDFLDYYSFIIIGYDLETYTPLSGSKCFQKAQNICSQGGASSYGKDWQMSSAAYSRYGLADELNSTKYEGARVAFNNYYFEGIDSIAIDEKTALDKMLKAIETIQQVRRRQNPLSVYVKQFFDTKFKEIADYFMAYPDRAIFDRLAAADAEHASVYREYRSRR